MDSLRVNEYEKYRRFCDHCHYTRKYRGPAHGTSNLKEKRTEKKTALFHNDSYYDYNFMNKELANEFEEQFKYLGKNIEKHIILLVLNTQRECQMLKKISLVSSISKTAQLHLNV